MKQISCEHGNPIEGPCAICDGPIIRYLDKGFSLNTYTTFKGLELGSYDLIMADPPWRFKNYSKKGEGKNAVSKYDCMTLPEICALPVRALAKTNCMLILWATNPMLPQALQVMHAWGFTYKTAGTWVKLTKYEKIAFGTGYILRSANEPFLIGTIGSVPTARNVRSVAAATREHSRKPDCAYDLAESLLSPSARKCELFSRESRQGWDVWGKEVDKFNVLVSGK